MIRAVFINLDNTLIVTKTGRINPLHSEDWKVNKDVLNVLVKLHKKDYKIVILSNQPQIRLGLTTEKAFKLKLESICRLIEKEFKFTEPLCYEYCTKEHSFNFMPNPGMIYDMANEHEIALGFSIMIGTGSETQTAARYAGIGKYYDISKINTII